MKTIPVICLKADSPLPPEPTWPAQHDLAIAREGWCVSDCGPGAWQTQCIDNVTDFPLPNGTFAPKHLNDEAAWQIVAAGTEPHHLAALDFIPRNSPDEHKAVQNFLNKKRKTP